MLVDNPLHPLHTIISLHFTPINPTLHYSIITHITHSYMFIHFIMYDPLSYIQVSILYYSPFTLVYICLI
ncbi:hypothetical protein [Pseudomonas phage vB_Pa-PAC2]